MPYPYLTCARPGGAVIRPPPSGFLADSEKTAARSAAKFAIPGWLNQPTNESISAKLSIVAA